MSEIVKHQCPFCGEWVKHHRYCNGFCSCSAKYYSQDQVWFNRKTGERRVESMTMRDRLIELPIDDAILILKEEHKQRVNGYTTHLSYGGKGDPAEEVSIDALEMAISALEQTKWISVKDRLPEKWQNVLAVRSDGKIRFDFICSTGCWYDDVNYVGYSVTHWMPLPQPPKGE